MHTLFAKRLPVRLLLLIIASALTACEASTSQDGPILSDGDVVIGPSSISLGTIGLGTCNGIAAATIVDTVTYTITTFNAQGQPIGNADIGITLSFAGNTTLVGPPLTQLVIDGVVVSNAGAPIISETQTDKKGNRQIEVRFETSPGCTYSGFLQVISGSVTEQSDFDVEGS